MIEGKDELGLGSRLLGGSTAGNARQELQKAEKELADAKVQLEDASKELEDGKKDQTTSDKVRKSLEEKVKSAGEKVSKLSLDVLGLEVVETWKEKEQPRSHKTTPLGPLFEGAFLRKHEEYASNFARAVIIDWLDPTKGLSVVNPMNAQTRELPSLWQQIIFVIPVLNSIVATTKLLMMLWIETDKKHYANPFWWRLFFEATDIRLSAIGFFYHVSTYLYTDPAGDNQNLSSYRRFLNVVSYASAALFEILLFICIDANRAVNIWENRSLEGKYLWPFALLKNNPQICFFLRVIGTILNILTAALLTCANPLIAGHAIGSNAIHLPKVIQTVSSGVYHSSASLLGHASGVANFFCQVAAWVLVINNSLTSLPLLALSIHEVISKRSTEKAQQDQAAAHNRQEGIMGRRTP